MPLGKGLESLIPDKNPSESSDISSASKGTVKKEPVFSRAKEKIPARTYEDNVSPRQSDSIFSIDVGKVEPNPFQPRRDFDEEGLQELALSIREHGLLQPVLVTKREIETPAGLDVRYQLISGERRWRAARSAGLSQIPAIIRRGIPDDRLRLELALIENVQREDLNPMERARAFRRLVDEFHLVQREIASRIGKSREMVANALRLCGLPQDIQDALSAGRITEGHARAVLMAGDSVEKQAQVYQDVISQELNVREAENRARQVAGKIFTPRKRAAAFHDPETREWQTKLQDRLGTRVFLQRIGDRGKIVVEFYSDEELRGIIRKLIHEA